VTRVWWFSVRFLGFYAILLIAFANAPLQRISGALVASGGSLVLQACLGRPVDWSVRGRDLVLSVPPQDGRQAGTATMSILEHTRNLPLFLAIVLATVFGRGRRPGRRVWYVVAAGSAALVLLDGLIVAAEAWQKLPDDVPYDAAYQVLSVFGVYHTTGAAGMFAAPVFVGALAGLWLSRDEAPRRQPGRNDLCSCGSGRKWKRCCGA
jgi:hypothetical protein